MHQSSSDRMLLICEHPSFIPLWHTTISALLFLINCIYIGYGIAFLESISLLPFGGLMKSTSLRGWLELFPWRTLVWLALCVGDLAWRQQAKRGRSLRRLFLFSFLAEVALLGIGSLLLLAPRNRRSPRWLFVSASLNCPGGALYRFNVYLIGFNPGKGWIYFPSLAEVLISRSASWPMNPRPIRSWSTGASPAEAGALGER